MRIQSVCTMLLAGAAFSLSACGGGGGGGVGSTPFVPTPTPTPSPTPTPTPGCTGADCLQAVDIFPAVDESTAFASLGLEASGSTASLASLEADGFAVSYDASAGVYIIDVPSSGPGAFYENTANTPNNRYWNGEIADAQANVSVGAAVFQPRATNPVIQLTYTTYAMYGSTYQGGPFGYVAFGTPTPAGSVPTTGTATYDAAVEGATLETGDYIKGTATLQFDFGAGTLAGEFRPVIYDLLAYGEGGLSLGRYDFVDTIYSAGSTSFSGELSQAGLTGRGSFEGLFTGPAAQELLTRWSAPFLDPRSNTTSSMFGVWVGNRGP